MAVNATFNIIEGSLADKTLQQTRVNVMGLIDGLTVDSDPDPEVIIRAIEACEAENYKIGFPIPGVTSNTNLILQRIQVRGHSNNACLAQLFYETPTFGGPASALIIRRRSWLASHTQNTLRLASGARVPLKIDPYIDTLSGEAIKGDLADVALLRPMRAVQVSGLVYGAAPPSDDDSIGYVNEGNFKGKPTGYWLMSEYETDISRYSGYYQFSCTAITRNSEPWSEYQCLKNQRDGKTITPDSTSLATLVGYAYEQGTRTDNGVMRVDPFPTTSFTPIFGSSNP